MFVNYTNIKYIIGTHLYIQSRQISRNHTIYCYTNTKYKYAFITDL